MKLPQPEIERPYRTANGYHRKVHNITWQGGEIYITGIARLVSDPDGPWFPCDGFFTTIKSFWESIVPEDRPAATLILKASEVLFLRGQMEACRETMEQMMPPDAAIDWMVNMHRSANAILEKLKIVQIG